MATVHTITHIHVETDPTDTEVEIKEITPDVYSLKIGPNFLPHTEIFGTREQIETIVEHARQALLDLDFQKV